MGFLCCFPLRTHAVVLSMCWSVSIPRTPLKVPGESSTMEPASRGVWFLFLPYWHSSQHFPVTATAISDITSLHFLSCSAVWGWVSAGVYGAADLVPTSSPLPSPPLCSEEAGHWLCMCRAASSSLKCCFASVL